MSFPQTNKPYYFPEHVFWNFEIVKDSNHVKKGPEVALKDHIRFHFAIWAFRATSGSYLTWFEPFRISQIQNLSPGKY